MIKVLECLGFLLSFMYIDINGGRGLCVRAIPWMTQHHLSYKFQIRPQCYYGYSRTPRFGPSEDQSETFTLLSHLWAALSSHMAKI